MTPEEEQALMMQMIDRHEQPAGPVSGVSMADPTQALTSVLSRQFNIPAEEIAVMAPPEGMTLRQHLEGLQPQMNMGGVDVGLNGSLKEPRIEVSGRF